MAFDTVVEPTYLPIVVVVRHKPTYLLVTYFSEHLLISKEIVSRFGRKVGGLVCMHVMSFDTNV